MLMPEWLLFATALALAWCWDLLLGEPRNTYHPVYWLGRLFTPLGQCFARFSCAWALIAGMLAWLTGALFLVGAAVIVQAVISTLPWYLGLALLTFCIKPAFAWRMLRDEVVLVEQALGHDLQAGRNQLKRLVSRDTSALSAYEVRESVIETLAENLNDSVVAALFWFALAGLPGLWVYRFANTLDAMWGYHDHREWAGKCAARADDMLSWIPARLTAMLIWLTHPFDPRQLVREAWRIPSPNGGWPMGAMALGLGVRLTKPGVYVLNQAGRIPSARDTSVALNCASVVAHGAFLLAFLMYCTGLR
jgi:adenosylcobinamide-phosphate synthase